MSLWATELEMVHSQNQCIGSFNWRYWRSVGIGMTAVLLSFGVMKPVALAAAAQPTQMVPIPPKRQEIVSPLKSGPDVQQLNTVVSGSGLSSSSPPEVALQSEASIIASSYGSADITDSFEVEIFFAAADYLLDAAAEGALAELLVRSRAKRNFSVHLTGGSALSENDRARDQALSRAITVHQFLVRKGLSSSSIVVKPVSDNDRRDVVTVSFKVSKA